MTPISSDMRITILGSGTCVPSLYRSACAMWVRTAGANLLFDIGPGTMKRLLQAGVAVCDVTHVFVSHFHPDHTGELAPFLFANQYPDGTCRKRPLTLVGGSGFSEFFQRLRAVYGRWIDLGQDRLGLIELDNSRMESRDMDGFTLTFGPVAHNPESVAYRITSPAGVSVVYSGDTDLCDSLVELARGADVLVCESAFPDEMKTAGHLSPSIAGHIATRAGVGHLVLTHFYPQCEAVDLETQCRKTWTGPLTLAQDLMVVEHGVLSR